MGSDRQCLSRFEIHSHAPYAQSKPRHSNLKVLMRPRLLYVSVNDGTDIRIAKEVATLARCFDVTFVGIRQGDYGVNRMHPSVRQIILPGRRRSPLTMSRLALEIYKLSPGSFDSVHVVNENLLLVFSPILIAARHLVVDVFDSMFLKYNGVIRLLRWPLQWAAHTLADVVLVTDEDRRQLVPSLFRQNVEVLPNYPLRALDLPSPRRASPGDPLRIFFSGSLAEGRGAGFLADLLAFSEQVEVVAAGYIHDDSARRLVSHPRVRYHGYVDSAEAARLALSCDYILCLYSPDVPNNIHASPNKIYDGMLLGLPVIINAEVLVSKLVEQFSLGVVLPRFPIGDLGTIREELVRRRSEFGKRPSKPSPFTWDAVEHVLLQSHAT